MDKTKGAEEEAERGKNEHTEYYELVEEEELERGVDIDTGKQSNLEVLKKKLEMKEDTSDDK